MSTDDTPTVPVPDGVAEDDLPQPGELPTTRVSQGYQPEQVDALIEGVFDAVRSGEPAPSIADATFDATRGVRKGYEEEAVDAYLDELSTAVGQQPTPDPDTRGTTHEVD
jgi:DivIVA domain-containing protein